VGSVQQIVAFALALFLGIGLHEYSHCKTAELMGDPTPRERGRVTLNLFKHFDVMGTVMILVASFIGLGIGWGNPAPMNPGRMRSPRWGFFTAVLAGPVSNVSQAFVWAGLYRLVKLAPETAFNGNSAGLLFPCLVGVFVNLGLAVFNLIPIGPLDGKWLLGLLMPPQSMRKWFEFNTRYGGMLLITMVVVSQLADMNGYANPLWLILGPPVMTAAKVLTGS
jgi:Zn-dependent protease